MKPDRPNVKFTVVDPNLPRETQKMLKLMIVEKLTAAEGQHGYRLSDERRGP